MQPLIERIISTNIHSRTLAALRDTLLPRLLSGEIDVDGIESDLEEAKICQKK
jgi:type I restriction enzyme S subunit